jgi:hypothetical protein
MCRASARRRSILLVGELPSRVPTVLLWTIAFDPFEVHPDDAPRWSPVLNRT